MKLKIVSLLLVVMILIFQLPAMAWNEVPVETLPDIPFDDTDRYWVMYHSGDDNVYLLRSHSPIKVETNEEYFELEYNPNIQNSRYKLQDGEWIYDGSLGTITRIGFKKVYKANHDLAYVDGSGFFFSCRRKHSARR